MMSSSFIKGYGTFQSSFAHVVTMLPILAVLVVFFLLGHSAADPSVCDLCVCRYSKNNEDFGDQVYCSYQEQNILEKELTLPSTVFSLDLSSSNLTRVHQSKLLRSETLIELYLSNNVISIIEIKSLQLPELKLLDLSNNNLESIDKEAFAYLIKLEALNLANNRFASFSNLGFHHLKNLNEIILDYNDLGRSLLEHNIFDRSSSGLTTRVRNISIRSINLDHVPENFFAETYDVRSLVVAGNHLKEIPELPSTLEYLDLSDNPIEEISEVDFADVPGLRELRLNNLWISKVPGFTFSPLRGLVTLELERNKNLTVFSKWAFGLEALEDAADFTLESLSFSGSRLSRLDEDLIVPFSQLIHLDLQGNPWVCDCDITWVKSLQIAEKDYDHLRCAEPRALFNARIFDLRNKYFRCEARRHLVGLQIAIVTFCITSTAIVLWLFVFLPRKNYLKHFYNPYKYTALTLPNNY
ncbi:leucine-rich repeats and immunoglobulin-like domains protein 2 [Plodia interpunctella]|uniref:leucine-rich repeats and immunoglobulin-like domains protein 2 n=1 Tax=Plodia interpunctella TaxID=58824 RepID=UPI00236857E2|nr:leucine-rich repeats and immunoglobulin-like domains protein 2 [Plodia interpunctella]